MEANQRENKFKVFASLVAGKMKFRVALLAQYQLLGFFSHGKDNFC